MNEANQRIKDKVALVTGGASGLGLAIASLMVRQGGTVIITDIASDQGILAAEQTGAEFMTQDVSDEGRWQVVLAHIYEKYDRLDILVNNAGISGGGPATDPETTTLDEWQKIQRINSDSVFLGCKYAIDYMRKGGGGANATAQMSNARAGRASYIHEDNLLGVIDPGAEAMARIFETIATII